MPPSSSSRRRTVAYRQWQGARAYQEDDFAILEAVFAGSDASPGLLLVLADGMGGEAGGAQASHTVVEAFMDGFPASDEPAGLRFEACLEEAGCRLRDIVTDDPDLQGMGSTVVAVHYDGKELAWLSVGDSPMWLFSDGRLARLNADHSMAQVLDRLVENGELSAEEARNDNRRNMLLSAVTGAQVEHVDCAKRPCRLQSDEYLLIASDGIQTLSDEDIERHLAGAKGNAEMAADALFSAVRADAGPGQDNVTFLLLSGGLCESGTVAQRTEQRVQATVPEAPVEAGRWGAASFRKGLGLGLIIGLLPAALFLWWPDERSPPETATLPEQPLDRSAQDDGAPADHDQPSAGEPPAEEAAPPSPAPADHDQPSAGEPPAEETAPPSPAPADHDQPSAGEPPAEETVPPSPAPADHDQPSAGEPPAEETVPPSPAPADHDQPSAGEPPAEETAPPSPAPADHDQPSAGEPPAEETVPPTPVPADPASTR